MWATATPRPPCWRWWPATKRPSGIAAAAWFALAAAPFFAGWWRRLLDFRIQAYLLAGLGVFGTALYQLDLAAGSAPPFAHPWISLVVAATLSYAAVLSVLWSAEDRFLEAERQALRLATSLAATPGDGRHRMVGVARRLPGTRVDGLGHGAPRTGPARPSG